MDAGICSESRKQVEEAELKMLRFCLGATRTDKMRNKQLGRLETQSETRLRWFGRVQRRNRGDGEGDTRKEDLEIVSVREDDVDDVDDEGETCRQTRLWSCGSI